MAAIDEFVGNLRAARGISNGLNGLRNTQQASTARSVSPAPTRQAQPLSEQEKTIIRSSSPRSFLIENNKDPSKDRHIRIKYDPETGAPASIEELFDDGTGIGYGSAEDFYKTLDRKGDYTIVSAPIDVAGPKRIKDLSDENDYYLSGATTYYDTEVDGEIDPAVFDFRNEGVRYMGDRRNYLRAPQLFKAEAPASYADTYRKNKIRDNTVKRAMRATSIYGTRSNQA